MEEGMDVVALIHFFQIFTFWLFFYYVVVLLASLRKFGMAEACFFLAQGAAQKCYAWRQSAGSKRVVRFLSQREKAQQHDKQWTKRGGLPLLLKKSSSRLSAKQTEKQADTGPGSKSRYTDKRC